VAGRRRGIFPIANPTRHPSAPLRLLELSGGSRLFERAVAGVAAKADTNGRPLIALAVSKSRLRAGWQRPHRFQAGRLSAGEERHLRFLPEMAMEVIFMLYMPASPLAPPKRVSAAVDEGLSPIKRAFSGMVGALSLIMRALHGMVRALPGMVRALPGIKRVLPPLMGDWHLIMRALP
jgi:hypothetical protein